MISPAPVVNIFAAHASDDENNDASDTEDATVTFFDVLPTVDLTKSVTPATRPEPGGVFTYALTFRNASG